jgi:hypothetical protein
VNHVEVLVPVVMKTRYQDSLSVRCDAIVDLVTRNLGVGEHRLISEPTGVHLALRVRKQTDDGLECVVVGQYFESRCCRQLTLIPTPEFRFIRQNQGQWVPLSMATPFEATTTASVLNGLVVIDNPGEHTRLLNLAEGWLMALAASPLMDMVQTRPLTMIPVNTTKVAEYPTYCMV